ncbi:MAG: HAD family hydrolase [candidate division KSB1 bacterium]|nr:HAD family hydrolase [candidate division KSB1 bacterium]MDZ7368435.1 HAD family hydrolase [candidate division KSB1 bacterium]MDZ7406161.1 HAD family hydrolase [candidate division KSB1 bacterium]
MTPESNDFVHVDRQPKNSNIEQTNDDAVWQNLRREVRAISLDLWGTILDDKQAPSDTILYSEGRQNFLREELQRCGYAISPEQMRAAYKHAWQYFDDLWAKQIAFGAAEGLREMLRYLHAELPTESFERVRQYFEEAYQDPQPLDGALEAVQRLAANYPLALISDTAWTPGRVLRQIFARYEILGCFRALIFSGEVGKTKPHPQMFHLALAGLGVQPQACLHVGDLQHTDIAGAKAAGMRSAWLRRPVYAGNEQHNHGPTVVVKSVREVAEKLLG